MGGRPGRKTIVVAVCGAVFGVAVSWMIETRGFWRAADPPGTNPTAAAAALKSAKAALTDRDLSTARRELERCVELSELPECHRRLGVLLSLQGDPEAAGHLERGGLAP